MSEIKIVRLQTGEEIIAKCKENKDSVVLKKMAIIIPAGQGRIGLSPFLPYCDIPDEGMTFNKKHVMFIVDPVSEFINEYNTAFGSGLVVPDSGVVGAVPNLKLTT
jgi:hypothetical protein